MRGYCGGLERVFNFGSTVCEASEFTAPYRQDERGDGLELVVEHGHDEALAAALARVVGALVRPHRVVCEHRALPLLIQACHDVERVVLEVKAQIKFESNV
jgi:hypothetical protein